MVQEVSSNIEFLGSVLHGNTFIQYIFYCTTILPPDILYFFIFKLQSVAKDGCTPEAEQRHFAVEEITAAFFFCAMTIKKVYLQFDLNVHIIDISSAKILLFTEYKDETSRHKQQNLPSRGPRRRRKKRKKKRKPCHSLYLLGIFVADENDDWVDVDAVETFDGVRSDVKQTVAVLHRAIHSKNINQTPFMQKLVKL